jgi:site-specific DNA recombinase
MASVTKRGDRLRAAVYTRKSNEDDRNEENKSVTRQRERGIAYAESKGWTVDPEHVFEDDGISGAEFERRHGLIRMLARLKEFDCVVVSELSRLGRDTVRTPVVIDDIRSKGVRIFYYLTDEEEHADTPEQQVMVSLKSFGAALERAKIAERTRDALSRKAEKGLSAGGRCYGYDCVWVLADGTRRIAPPGGRMKDDTRLHTDWQINEEQAGVVRGIFQMYANGHGHTAIAKTLNGESRYRVQLDRYFGGQTPPSPQHGEQGTGSWAPSTIRFMLYRIRYAGKVQYGEFRNVRSSGRVGKCVKQDKFTVVDREDLRIVPADLWDMVQKRLGAVRETYVRTNNGQVWARPEAGRESKYLLSGLARCGCQNGEHVCGRNMIVSGGYRQSNWYYRCSYNQNRGNNACANNLPAKLAEWDARIIGEIESRFLTPAAMELYFETVSRRLGELRKNRPDELPRLEAQLRRERAELANFMRLIASGNAPESILSEISERENRIARLQQDIAGYDVVESKSVDSRRDRKHALEQIERFREVLMSDVSRSRQALRKLFRDEQGNFSPLWFIPREGRGYEVRGVLNLSATWSNGCTEDTHSSLLHQPLPFEIAA